MIYPERARIQQARQWKGSCWIKMQSAIGNQVIRNALNTNSGSCVSLIIMEDKSARWHLATPIRSMEFLDLDSSTPSTERSFYSTRIS
jgi:hypothetical protein